MRTYLCFGAFAAVGVLAASLSCAGCAGEADAADGARRILEAGGMKAGLCVELGGDAERPLALAGVGAIQIHALVRDEEQAAAASRLLHEQGRLGMAMVEAWADFARLPFRDHLVNLVVLHDPKALFAAGLTPRELGRIVAPFGALLVKGEGSVLAAGAEAWPQAGFSAAEPVSEPAGWMRLRKTFPEAMDEWTHRYRAPGRSMVSNDRVFAPLSGLRWLAGPELPIGSDRKEDNRMGLSAGGRVFYLTKAAPENLEVPVPERDRQFHLVARDAFNGLLLWTRKWNDAEVVAAGDLLYAYHPDGRLETLDAATGQTIQDFGNGFPQGQGPLILHLEDKLLLHAGETLQVLEAATAKPLWSFKTRGGVNWLYSNSYRQNIVAGDGRVFVLDQAFRALDLQSGKVLWETQAPTGKAMIEFYKDGVLVVLGDAEDKTVEAPIRQGNVMRHSIYAADEEELPPIVPGKTATIALDGQSVAAFDARTGVERWKKTFYPAVVKGNTTVLHAGGLIWIVEEDGVHKSGRYPARDFDLWTGLDPLTGEARRTFRTRPDKRGCNRIDLSSEDFLVCRRPPDLYDWKEGQRHKFLGARFSCEGGGLLANGILYTMPQSCGCVGRAARGFLALHSQRNAAAEAASFPLEKGPAFEDAPARPAGEPSSAWPAFRAQAHRGAAVSQPVSPQAALCWEFQAAPPCAEARTHADRGLHRAGADLLTQATVADGRLFVSFTEGHGVLALDAASGRKLWTHWVAGRLDAPPTLYKSLCLVGAQDGWIYGLQAADGQRVWRLRAAPRADRIVAFGQVASVWPVEGGVLVLEDKAFAVAGRVDSVDGGNWLHAFDPLSGKIQWSIQPEGYANQLTGAGSAIGMGNDIGRFQQTTFSTKDGKAGARLEANGYWLHRDWQQDGALVSRQNGKLQVRSFHEFGHLLSFDERQAYLYSLVWKNAATGERKGSVLLASSAKQEAWKVELPLPLQIESLIVTGDVLWAAGPKNYRKRNGEGFLWALSVQDGRKLRELSLETAPVSDGLSSAGGRLYLVTRDGKIRCFGEQ